MVLVWSEPGNFNGKREGWEPEISSYPYKFRESRRTVLWQGPGLISKQLAYPSGLHLRFADAMTLPVLSFV